MDNELGKIWAKTLKQMDVKEVLWLYDNNVFGNSDNKFIKHMNDMLLNHLEEKEKGE